MAIDPAIKKAVQTTIRVASRLTPPLATRLSWALFCTPLWASRPTPGQAAVLAEADRFEIQFGRRRLQGYRWGRTGPLVMMIHGWGGRAHVFGELVPSLRDRGLSLVSFDAPGHYRLGQRTNLLEYASAVRAVAREVGPVHGLCGHSFGAFTAAYMAQHLPELQALSLLGAPDKMDFLLDYAQQELQAPHHIRVRLANRIEKLSGIPVNEHTTAEYLSELPIEKLLIHDRKDKEVPFERIEKLGAELDIELFATDGWGHHRILRSPEVAGRLGDFFTG